MRRLTLVSLAPVVLLAFVAAACGGSEPAAPAPAPEPAQTEAPPAVEAPDPVSEDEAAAEGRAADEPQEERRRLAPPVRGLAEIGYLKPDTNVEGDQVVTVFRLKNLSNGSILRLQIEEFWWDRNDNPVTGDRQTLREPLQPGEVSEITLRAKRDPRMFRNNYQFSHANGNIKATVLQSLD